jgi:hypothetical protein
LSASNELRVENWMHRVTFLLFAVASSALAADLPAIDIPTMKPGLWESKVAREGTTAPQPIARMCLDAAVQKEMMGFGMGAMKSMCSKNDLRREGNKLYGNNECKIGESTMRSTSVTTFNGDSSYHTEVKATYDPPMMGKAGVDTVVDAKWVGPCPAGMQPGEMIMPNGQKMNVRGMTAPSKSQ